MTNLCVINIYDYGYSQTWLQTFILIYAHILVVGSLEVVLLWKVCKKLLFALLSLRHNEQHLMTMENGNGWESFNCGWLWLVLHWHLLCPTEFGVYGKTNVTRFKLSGVMFVTRLWMKMCSRVNLAGWKALTTAVTCSPLRSGQFRGKIKGNGV